jgi:hypothetical protein
MNRPELISDRENDNALCVDFSSTSGKLTVAAQQRLGALNIWLRFRLQQLQPHATLTLDVQALDPVAGSVPLYLSWDDGRSWSRSGDAQPPYRIDIQGPNLEVSRNLPYPYARLQQWQDQVRGRLDRVGHLQTLCLSPQQRAVPIFVTHAPRPDAPLIWVQARSHAFESHSSHVAEALIHWLLGDEARPLRERAVVCVVPMIDVDAVAAGSGGKERTPHDPNRDYSIDHYPQVRSIKQRLQQLTQSHRLRIFIDLHSPWFHTLSLWFIGRQTPEHVAPIAERFPRILDRIQAANSWHHELRPQKPRAEQVGPVEPRTSTAWAKRLSPDAIAMTMEIPHHVDGHGRSITPQGLVDYARALGLSFEACADATACR